MASQGPLNPGTSADDAGTGTETWANVGTPGNVAASDDARCTVALTGGNPNSHWLVATNFGFTIPSGATIDGVEFTIERKTTAGGIGQDRFIRLVVGGTIETHEKAVAVDWPTADGVATYGGATDTWGHEISPLTPAQINASDFGIAISAKRMSGSPTAGVDHVTAKVYYHLSSLPPFRRLSHLVRR